MSKTKPKSTTTEDGSGDNDNESLFNDIVLEPRRQTTRPEDDIALAEDARGFECGPRTSSPGTSGPGTSGPGTSVQGLSASSTSGPGTSSPGPSGLGTSFPGNSNMQNNNDRNTQSSFKFEVGIFSGNREIARRIKQRIVGQNHTACIYENWPNINSDSLPEKCVSFIEECMLIFWVASPGGDKEYMNHAKNVAHHDCIKKRPYRSFIVFIPEEHLDMPITELVPKELQPYDPVEEDEHVLTKINSRIRGATIKRRRSDESDMPACKYKAVDSSSNATEKPGTMIKNVYHITGNSVVVGSNVLVKIKTDENKTEENKTEENKTEEIETGEIETEEN